MKHPISAGDFNWINGGRLLALLLLVFVAPVQAYINDGLFLSLANEPDIGSSGVGVTYDADAIDADTGLLTAYGNASTIRTGGVSHSFDFPGFDRFILEAEIDNATGNATDGLLRIFGEVSDLGFNSGTMLTGSLSGFGSGLDVGNDTLHFLFDNLDGDAAALYGGTAGVIMSQTGAPGGLPSLVFSRDFTNLTPGFPAAGFADTGGVQGVPEPGTLVLVVGGVLILARRQRMKLYS